MKQKIIFILLLIVAVTLLVLFGCSLFGGQEPAVTQTTTDVSAVPETDGAPATADSSVTDESKTAARQTEETTAPTAETTAADLPVETTEQEEQTQSASADGSRTVGVSAKGYEIVEINGLTYVDGLLIVNKTYSLPSSYTPGALTSETSAAFDRMQADAAAEGLNLYVSSGFRSYELQTSLYNRYVAADGKAAADRYSARPGHSEHQTGLAMDLNTITNSFADTAEGKWVDANCYKYGFILRYPLGKEAETGYMYEPWHLRYVGVEKAAAIYNSGLTLEEYYGLTSVYD
ncbi:MAG: M15 family metallopeptidase [Clostridia bacterium]|nr:M15 family metallopeptidase [Clostridia bacterium]